MYVFGMMWALLAGFVAGWFMYNGCMGSKKDRMRAGIMWGVGIAVIAFACAFS